MPAPHSLLSLRLAELLALELQLTDPPRPMSPALHDRLALAFRNTEQEVDALLRAAYNCDQAGQ